MRELRMWGGLGVVVMLGLLLLGIGTVHAKRQDYPIPAAWQPILQGKVHTRTALLTILDRPAEWTFENLVDLKGYDLAIRTIDADRFVELLVFYSNGQLRRVTLQCTTRSLGLFNRMETHQVH